MSETLKALEEENQRVIAENEELTKERDQYLHELKEYQDQINNNMHTLPSDVEGEQLRGLGAELQQKDRTEELFFFFFFLFFFFFQTNFFSSQISHEKMRILETENENLDKV